MGRERFARAFRREFGLAFARVRRFSRALSRREREPSLDGAAMAAACGYFDQAHMVSEFRELAGASPSALWRQDCPTAEIRGLRAGTFLQYRRSESI
jgi:AraC-like DNA-binding protein